MQSPSTQPIIKAKICGVREPQIIEVAAQAGAAYVGFVFFKKSPRYVSIEQARLLAQNTPTGVAKVGLFVNPTKDELAAVLEAVPLDMVQLHGAETLEQVAQIKQISGLPVMKALGIASKQDVQIALSYAACVDQLLLDAKPALGAALPGGNGLRFDWSLVSKIAWPVPWMLAGGLTAQNVAQAVQISGAKQVDVSSGVERATGCKDATLVRAFMQALA